MEPTRIFDFIYYQRENHPLDQSFGYHHQGEWVYFSTEEVIERSLQVSRGLIERGIQPGDKVGLVTYQNRPEWTIVDLGILQAGAITVPVYPTISSEEYEYIFNDSTVRICFVGKDDLYDKVANAKTNVPSLDTIYTFDRQAGRPYWEELFCEEGQEEVERRKANIRPEDLATIIYTSGTTGKPKGVMLSHQNIVSNVKAVQRLLPIQPNEKALSFLPLCHIFERTASYSYMYNCCQVIYTGTDNLGGEEGDLKAVQPHFFTTVPRLLEKVYEKIYKKGLDLSGISRAIFFWALQLTDDFEYDKKYRGWEAVKRNIADKLVFSKWREALGGNIKGILTGAAPCPVKMARVFSAAGIPIREGYGLTETSPGLAVGHYEEGGALLGAVGPAIDGVELMIDDSDGNYRPGEGEILAKGPNIMMGYYKRPEETAEVIREINGERWFCTGDIGRLVPGPNGQEFLQITDRKKELLKTSGGKYVAPAPIENKFKEDFLVEQIMVIGDQQKFVSAIILPDKDALREWCRKHGIDCESIDQAIENPEVVARYQKIVDRYNPLFSHVEQIKKFRLIPDNWEASKADGSDAELTPTLKLKRRVINEKYKREIAELYQN